MGKLVGALVLPRINVHDLLGKNKPQSQSMPSLPPLVNVVDEKGDKNKNLSTMSTVSPQYTIESNNTSMGGGGDLNQSMSKVNRPTRNAPPNAMMKELYKHMENMVENDGNSVIDKTPSGSRTPQSSAPKSAKHSAKNSALNSRIGSKTTSNQDSIIGNGWMWIAPPAERLGLGSNPPSAGGPLPKRGTPAAETPISSDKDGRTPPIVVPPPAQIQQLSSANLAMKGLQTNSMQIIATKSMKPNTSLPNLLNSPITNKAPQFWHVTKKRPKKLDPIWTNSYKNTKEKKPAVSTAVESYQPITRELLEQMDRLSEKQINRDIRKLLTAHGGPFTEKAEAIKKVENEWKSVRQVTPLRKEKLKQSGGPHGDK